MRHRLQEAFCTGSWASESCERPRFSEKVEEAERVQWMEGQEWHRAGRFLVKAIGNFLTKPSTLFKVNAKGPGSFGVWFWRKGTGVSRTRRFLLGGFEDERRRGYERDMLLNEMRTKSKQRECLTKEAETQEQISRTCSRADLSSARGVYLWPRCKKCWEERKNSKTSRREKNRRSSAAVGLGGMMRNAAGWAVERCCLLGDRGAAAVPCRFVGPRRAQLGQKRYDWLLVDPPVLAPAPAPISPRTPTLDRCRLSLESLGRTAR
jgi:hypothetical protein